MVFSTKGCLPSSSKQTNAPSELRTSRQGEYGVKISNKVQTGVQTTKRSCSPVRFSSEMKNSELSDEALEMIASRFGLLASPSRLRILNSLGDQEFSVGEIVVRTDTNQATVSKHLSTLFNAGILSRRKEGLTVYYRVSDQTIFNICDIVCDRLRDQLETRQMAFTNVVTKPKRSRK